MREAVLLTLPWLAGAVLLKWALVNWVPAMHGLPLLQMFSPPPAGMPASGFKSPGWRWPMWSSRPSRS
ncbi:MAG: hypothetical protein IPM99_07220 [Rubrivivax sp.]|nr:hypothetical protein [Rubrivivax sp.]